MRLNLQGKLVDEPAIRVGFIGCGGHAFRNVYPALQFAPVQLVATCDLDADKAAAFAKQFGGERSYADHRQMLETENLDAVFIVTNYDAEGRPLHVQLAADCLRAGKHVWMEKPPAASCRDIEMLQALARGNGGEERIVLCGMKKMFFPANEKVAELMRQPDFGRPMLATLQYPQQIPTVDELRRYLDGRERVGPVVSFLDHLCHPVSLLLFLFGMPSTLFYQRAASGAGAATFGYDDGRVATLTLTHGSAYNGGAERTAIVSERGHHITVDNNTRVSYHRDAPGRGYGTSTSFYNGTPEQTSAVWEPEFSLGQLYNKGLFLLGYCGEVNEFATALLQNRPVSKCHLDHAWQATRVFEAFAEGPGKLIRLAPTF